MALEKLIPCHRLNVTVVALVACLAFLYRCVALNPWSDDDNNLIYDEYPILCSGIGEVSCYRVAINETALNLPTLNISTILFDAKRVDNETYVTPNNTRVHLVRTERGLSASFTAHGVFWRLLPIRYGTVLSEEDEEDEFTHDLVELEIPPNAYHDDTSQLDVSPELFRKTAAVASATTEDAITPTLICSTYFPDHTVCCPSTCETCKLSTTVSASPCVVSGRNVSCETHAPPCSMLVEHRVSVAYTGAVRDSNSDVAAIVRLAIKETNEAYANSRVPITLVLSDLYLSELEDTTDSATLLIRFRELGDLRSGHFTVLLSQYISSCGRAYIDCTKYDPSVYCSFGVVRVSCATGYYSFGHEIGHIQGLDHNEPFDNPNSRFPDNHGYIPSSGSWVDGAIRTIMAYSVIDELRVPYFSNPNLKYQNKIVLGEKNKADNARVLLTTRYDVTRLNPNIATATHQPTVHPTKLPTRKPTKNWKLIKRRRRIRRRQRKQTAAKNKKNG